MSLEDRIERLERLLIEVLDRLSRLERYLNPGDREALRIASNLVMASMAPASAALESAYRVLSILGKYTGIDPISRSIIEVLSPCEELSASEITRRVREVRGSASRRIISGRLRMLEEKGVVVRSGRRPRYRYRLVECR